MVSKPVTQQITDYFEFPGQTAAVGEVEIRARVTGYLVKVNFEDGQNVKKGDLLYEIDPRPTRRRWIGRKASWRGCTPCWKRPRPTWPGASGSVLRAPSARTSTNNTRPI